MKIIFLDIDGCMNDHTYNKAAASTTILPRCVEQLNYILDETDGNIVLISAWRYMILKEAMTLRGFEYLLRTHVMHCVGRLIGYTNFDIDVKNPERAEQIKKWMNKNNFQPAINNYVILDDFNFYRGSILENNFIWIEGKIGLTKEDADSAIAILNGR